MMKTVIQKPAFLSETLSVLYRQLREKPRYIGVVCWTRRGITVAAYAPEKAAVAIREFTRALDGETDARWLCGHSRHTALKGQLGELVSRIEQEDMAYVFSIRAVLWLFCGPDKEAPCKGGTAAASGRTFWFADDTEVTLMAAEPHGKVPDGLTFVDGQPASGSLH